MIIMSFPYFQEAPPVCFAIKSGSYPIKRMAVRSSFITRRRRVPLSFPLGSSEARPKVLQAALYARHRLPRPLLCSKPSSRLSKRSTNSSCSFCFISVEMARR